MNEPGDDPYQIGRFAETEDFLLSLPVSVAWDLRRVWPNVSFGFRACWSIRHENNGTN